MARLSPEQSVVSLGSLGLMVLWDNLCLCNESASIHSVIHSLIQLQIAVKSNICHSSFAEAEDSEGKIATGFMTSFNYLGVAESSFLHMEAARVQTAIQ